MPAQLWVTGPCDVYVGFGSGQTGTAPASPVTAFYLGTGQSAPRVHIDDAWKPVFNDLKGSAKPFDKIYLAESGVISVNLGRWDELIYAQLASQPNQVSGTRGKNVIGDMGTMMLQEGMATCVWLKFPYQSYSAYSNMPPGYRFPGCSLVSTDFDPLGLDSRVLPLVFESESVYNTSDGSFTHYDFNMSGLPARS